MQYPSRVYNIQTLCKVPLKYRFDFLCKTFYILFNTKHPLISNIKKYFYSVTKDKYLHS